MNLIEKSFVNRKFKSPLTLSHLKGQTDTKINIEEENQMTTLSISGSNKCDILNAFRNVLNFLHPGLRVPVLPTNVEEMVDEANTNLSNASYSLIQIQKQPQPIPSKSPSHFLPYRSCYTVRVIIPISFMNIFLHPEYKRSK